MALSIFRHAGSEAWKSDTTYRRVPRRFDPRFSSGICPAYGVRESATPSERLAAGLVVVIGSMATNLCEERWRVVGRFCRWRLVRWMHAQTPRPAIAAGGAS